MKLLIEIPDNYKQRLDEDFDNLNTGSIGCTSILMAVKEGVPIPDNAKNIDVLMTVFPKADIRFEGRNNELSGYIEFAGDWLEAPYKADRDKDNELTNPFGDHNTIFGG